MKFLAQMDGITRHGRNRAALRLSFVFDIGCFDGPVCDMVTHILEMSMESKPVFPAVVSAVCGIVEACELLPWVKAHDFCFWKYGFFYSSFSIWCKSLKKRFSSEISSA